MSSNCSRHYDWMEVNSHGRYFFLFFESFRLDVWRKKKRAQSFRALFIKMVDPVLAQTELSNWPGCLRSASNELTVWFHMCCAGRKVPNGKGKTAPSVKSGQQPIMTTNKWLNRLVISTEITSATTGSKVKVAIFFVLRPTLKFADYGHNIIEVMIHVWMDNQFRQQFERV